MIIATAGHVDHGKTSIVKALTGTDTDRLEEEKRRGLSLDLGFAYTDIEGERLGFVDVPGHRRFINNMISGIHGIDCAMLLVATDDGPMPQTLEHLDVLRLLGVTRCLLVISKCDKQPDGAAIPVDLSRHWPYELPRFEVSTRTGEGISELRSALAHMAKTLPERCTDQAFRMCIDRSFTLKGSGLVLAGTVTSGSVSVGDSVHLWPQARELRVRSLHRMGLSGCRAQAGERVAINVVGDLAKGDLQRGDWLSGKQTVELSDRVALRFTAREPGFELQPFQSVTLHIGARRVKARARPLQGDYLQLVCSEPILSHFFEPCLLRDQGESKILGAGLVMGSASPKNPKRALLCCQALDSADAKKALHNMLEAGFRVPIAKFQSDRLLTDKQLKDLTSDPRYLVDQGALLACRVLNEIKAQVLAALRSLHAADARASGFAASEVYKVVSVDAEIIQLALKQLLAAGQIRSTDTRLALTEHKQILTGKLKQLWNRLEPLLCQFAVQLPTVQTCADELDIPVAELASACRYFVENALLVQVAKRLAHPQQLQRLADVAIELGSFATADFKRTASIGRNVCVDVLEYFDSIGLTRRDGSMRTVQSQGKLRMAASTLV